jgi:hypothetical protein
MLVAKSAYVAEDIIYSEIAALAMNPIHNPEDRLFASGRFAITLLRQISPQKQQMYQASLAVLDNLHPIALDHEDVTLVQDLFLSSNSLFRHSLSNEASQNLTFVEKLHGTRRLAHLIAKVRLNSFSGTDNPLLTFLFTATSMINHSCDPNTAWNLFNGCIVIIALRDIAVGEELTIRYNNDWTALPYLERQKAILNSYFFKCECNKCKKEMHHVV